MDTLEQGKKEGKKDRRGETVKNTGLDKQMLQHLVLTWPCHRSFHVYVVSLRHSQSDGIETCITQGRRAKGGELSKRRHLFICFEVAARLTAADDCSSLLPSA